MNKRGARKKGHDVKKKGRKKEPAKGEEEAKVKVHVWGKEKRGKLPTRERRTEKRTNKSCSFTERITGGEGGREKRPQEKGGMLERLQSHYKGKSYRIKRRRGKVENFFGRVRILS